MHVHTQNEGQQCLPQLLPILYFEMQSFTEPGWTGWKSQEASCLCLPGAGITDIHHYYIQLLYGCWVGGSGLRSLRLYSKHFISQAISLAPRLLFSLH